ncbi:class I SAM-dependent methyltransferase [Xanthobacter sediminis]
MAMQSGSSLGHHSHLSALQTIVGDLRNRSVLDVGCDDGQLVLALNRLGARSIGADPHMKTGGSPSCICARAGSIPLPSGSFDLVTFIFSLHHLQEDELESGLREARRLIDTGGMLYIAEPLATGPFQSVIELFHDETQVRAVAAAALLTYAAPHFASHVTAHYIERRAFADFEEFASRMAARSFNDYTESAIRRPEVRQRFQAVHALHGGFFDQPVRVDCFSGPS